MFSVQDSGATLCDRVTRREWLRIGSVGIAGLSLPALLNARQSETSLPPEGSFGKARSCILLGLLGGPPQQETWDPKPDAPTEVRGPFQPISSSVPGLQVCELMPRIASLAHRFAVLRAVTTGDSAHSSSGYYMLTGRPHQPTNQENARPGAPNDWPCMGAIVRHLRGDRAGLPASIAIPEHIWNTGNIPWPGQDAGWLGRTADPWLLPCEPTQRDFRIPSLTLPEELPPLRFDERKSLLKQVNRHLDSADASVLAPGYDLRMQQAFNLLRSRQARLAFDLQNEAPRMRDRYGWHRFGQSCLLARRLVEAGVSLVQINWTRIKNVENDGTWDTHAKNADTLKNPLMPMMDQAVAALLEDLHDRGLLEETLVVWLGEFGRTPKINGAGGRDHWGNVFSMAMAGGGIRGGVVFGASDRIAAYPKDGRVTPPDLHATIHHCLGIRPETEIRDNLGRPVPISRGDVIQQIVS